MKQCYGLIIIPLHSVGHKVFTVYVGVRNKRNKFSNDALLSPNLNILYCIGTLQKVLSPPTVKQIDDTLIHSVTWDDPEPSFRHCSISYILRRTQVFPTNELTKSYTVAEWKCNTGKNNLIFGAEPNTTYAYTLQRRLGGNTSSTPFSEKAYFTTPNQFPNGKYPRFPVLYIYTCICMVLKHCEIKEHNPLETLIKYFIYYQYHYDFYHNSYGCWNYQFLSQFLVRRNVTWSNHASKNFKYSNRLNNSISMCPRALWIIRFMYYVLWIHDRLI